MAKPNDTATGQQSTESAPAKADDFASVFEEITREVALGTEPADTAAAAASAGDAAGAAAESAVAATESAAAGAPQGVDPAEAAAADAAVAEKSDADKLGEALSRVAELEAAAKKPAATEVAATEQEPAATEAAATEAPQVQWYQPNDEEKGVLAEFEKQWPEVQAAVAVRSKIDIQNTIRYVFSQMMQRYDPQLKRFAEVAEVMEDQLTLIQLRGQHSDYDTIHGKVVEWVTAMPNGYIKRAAQQVLKEGAPEDVAELFSQYKEKNPAAAPVASAAKAPAAKGKTELSSAARKAAVSLSVVDSKRTDLQHAPDPNDFSSAWDEATAG